MGKNEALVLKIDPLTAEADCRLFKNDKEFETPCCLKVVIISATKEQRIGGMSLIIMLGKAQIEIQSVHTPKMGLEKT